MESESQDAAESTEPEGDDKKAETTEVSNAEIEDASKTNDNNQENNGGTDENDAVPKQENEDDTKTNDDNQDPNVPDDERKDGDADGDADKNPEEDKNVDPNKEDMSKDENTEGKNDDENPDEEKIDEEVVEIEVIPQIDPLVILRRLCEKFIRRVDVSGITKESWQEENIKSLERFIEDTSIPTLVVYLDTNETLQVEYTIPTQVVEELAYFIREPGTVLTPENFYEEVECGTVQGDPTESLLHFVTSLHSDEIDISSDWETGIKDNYINGMHNYLAILTDHVSSKESKTVLYIPMEGLIDSAEESSKDTHLVQRMESVLIHWTDQIKELLNVQETSRSNSRGPVEEIAYWESHAKKLREMSKQLQKPGVKLIQHMLELANSLYVKRFLKLAMELQDSSLEAQSNLNFLSLLSEPCEELRTVPINELAPKLQHIIYLIRIIWTNSTHYNTNERITGLFLKMSYEIINLCIKSISLDKIFEGYVTSSKKDLNTCIQCCMTWKDMYLQTSELHHENSKKGWMLDQTNIFVPIDACIQRMKDLLEVCNTQQQFARWEDGNQRPLPCFSGYQGPELTLSLMKIEAKFQQGLQMLRSMDQAILEVENNSWHIEFNRFRAFLKDLDVMLQNLITSVFKTVNSVEEGLRLMDIFKTISARKSIKNKIDEMVDGIYAIFKKEISMTMKPIDQKMVLIPDYLPPLAGQAHRARAINFHLESLMDVIQKIPIRAESHNCRQVRVHYQQSIQTLNELVTQRFAEWYQSLELQYVKKLERPLLFHGKDNRIEVNFDNNLLNLFGEIKLWTQQKFDVPESVSEIYQDREDLRCLRERALHLARDYNRIIGMLTPIELGLFSKKIRDLDKKIQPGFTKLFWMFKISSNTFVKDCIVHISKVQVIVDGYKASNLTITNLLHQISETMLIRLDGKTLYRNWEFENDQRTHRQRQHEVLRSALQRIIDIMTDIHNTFAKDGREVQEHWVTYTDNVDQLLEEALRSNVKRSMQKLSQAINGDRKSSPTPLFKVLVSLRQPDPQAELRVEFSPSLRELCQIVDILPQIINTVAKFKRLPELLSCQQSHKKPIHVKIENDAEIKGIQAAVGAGMASTAGRLRDYLMTWDKYRDIWETNKDSYIKRYQKLNQPVASFDADIHRYTEIETSIQQEETVTNFQFIVLDCSPLKTSLVQHCSQWQTKFMQLLLRISAHALKDMHASMNRNSKRLNEPNETLAQLSQSLGLLESFQLNSGKTESDILLIHEQFAVLDKYGFPLDQTVQDLRGTLNTKWEWFQQVLVDSDVMLQGQKHNFKSGLLNSSDELNEKVFEAVQEFNTTGPFESTYNTNEALKLTAQHYKNLELLKEEDNLILQGLSFFKIEQEPSKTIQALEKDMDFLQQVWDITLEWETNWNSWKGGQFSTLRTENMENTAQDIYKILHKLQRQLKDKNWEIVDCSKKKVDQFRRIMPLIADMRNPAMRDRHWKQICDEVQSSFDHTSVDFTLEKIIALGFDKFSDKISDISGAASKELSIEQGLHDIIQTWEDLTLDIIPYKEKGHFRLRGTEDIFQALEDNQVTLSTMKASRFVKAFDKEVDKWERQLSLVMEIIEMVLTVQRQWLYLENIFQGKDIREQLPGECKDFEAISKSWKTIMTRLNETGNALEGTHHPGLMETLSTMNTKLEEIQKALDMYLETKRQIFPRFYFLSNDDVLEILGQSQNPEAMQPHLKKCFDNIKSLRTEKVSKRLDATAMYSSDGELVEFIKAVPLDKPVEIWLCDIEKAMRSTLKNSLYDCMMALKKMKNQRDKWTKDWPGQMLITASQIQWTTDVTQSLVSCKELEDKGPLKIMMKKQVSMLRRYSDMIRSNLAKVLRLKIVGLVTVEVHARDVIAKLAKAGCNDVNAFEWLCQLRLYWEKDVNNCIIRQTNTHFKYGYEYLGNSGRLVITPLTDRCYMTLTTALHLHRGGSPKGPAGTGKTETTKDLGKSLGMYVIVINCSEGLDYKSMGRMFSGLAQTGAWGCFDEFNRINIEVLSVVAQQILSILSALSALQTRFQFEEHNIALMPSCGVFITMNPGYAGRSELPDNLKSMFRPISMVVPDSTLIAEIILFGEGFNDCKLLAKKVFTLYSLAMQQLSKQDHYDFGLRALTSLLRYAGKKRRVCPNVPGEEVLLMAMKDMNIAKLTSADLPLFTGIIQDLFPDVETPVIDYGKLKEAIQVELRQKGLQITAFTLTKVIQMYETMNSRHSSMLVGKTGCGKTVTWKTLKNSLISLHNKEEPGYELVQDYPLNPKSMSLGELYGENDLSTNEWSDGVLSSVMRIACADEKPDEKWIVFDGPVDTLWIESMNSVMDDNKVLTLINGERISMPEQVSLLFEVENLAQASPATVSRCGMVYNDYVDLGWKPFVKSWLEQRDKAEVAHLKPLFDNFIEKTLLFKKKNCKELIPITELNGIMSLCRLYEALTAKKVKVSDKENLGRIVELWFTFSLIWSICASVDEEGRKRMDNFLREVDGTFPIKDTVYEYYVNMETKAWAPFENKLPKSWRFNINAPFYKIMVPTVDTVRYNFLVAAMVNAQYPVLLTGPVGTGKTSVVHGVLHSLDSGKWSTLTINMSSQTTSNNIQAIIESRLEKRTKGVYVPVGGKDLLCYLDDLNMPAHDQFGSQPPLELMRLWIDYGFWFDRQKQTTTYVKKMSLLASMGPPGGGRTHISERLQSRFNLINMTFPNDSTIKRIFSTMINQKLQIFKEDVKPFGDLLTQATLELYYSVTTRFLPTPAKTHYLFNLRDISKVFQGLLRAHPEFHDSKVNMVRLWIHECFRVFSDRLIDHSDMNTFTTIVGEKMASHFDLVFHNVCPEKQPPVFGDFLTDSGVYEDILDMSSLKKFMETHLEEYNLTPGVVPMNLVLFRDAIEHITRVVRVISQPRGNMLLVGIGGSGRQSLARMASSICEYKVFEVEITKQYRNLEFRDDVKKLYRQTGVDSKPTMFLFNDTQIVVESFLEDINNILSSGEVPNLYKPDEFVEICNSLSDAARKENVLETPNSLFSFLIERVRSNLHIVLCMSPVGDPFRNRILQYPALVNCTTIDWFCEWPRDALLEVAERYLAGLDLGSEGGKTKVAFIFVTTHQSVMTCSERMKVELKRYNYVTPTNYLELVSGYKKLLAEKRSVLGDQVNKLRNGLFKISDTGEKVAAMTVELEESNKQVADYQKECDEYLTVIVQQTREADTQQKTVSAKKEKISVEESQCKALADAALKELDEALPALDEATKALKSINKQDMVEIKSYTRPPALVEKVMLAVLTLLNKEPNYAEAKKQLSDPNFLKTLINFDKDNISDRILKRIGNYCRQPDFMPETIGKVSLAAKSLCMWVRAMEVYGCIFRVVEPKRELLNAATSQLAGKQAELLDSENKLKEVADMLARLNKQYGEKVATKEELKRRSDEMEIKLDRADKLVKGLAGEGVRWEETVKGLEKNMGYLVGDCLLAASFLSYMGPFLSNYRVELLEIWMKAVQTQEIQCTPGFSFATFLSDPTAVRDWNIQGLPSDAFSTENGVIVTRGNRWPLMVDPQGQAMKWIKKMEMAKGLKLIDFQMPDYMLIVENAIQFGNPVLLQNVQEDLDPALNPVLNKSLSRIGGRLLMKLGDKELEYSPEFRFYITTKLSNPHYAPEISTKTTIVNFAVKEQGLEAQLLGIVVRKERPDLEEQKDNLVMSIASGKRSLQELEDEILRLLNEASGSLLDDVQLVNTLQTSKVTATEVSEQLETSEVTEVQIDTAREGYRACAQRASILFFILNDMGRIDPMYQFSLDAYINLFNLSIEKSKTSSKLEERISNLNDYHTYAVYKYACRGLFEMHKLLFSFQMCAKILEVAGTLNMDEYSFFLRGGIVLDKRAQMENPCASWLVDSSWDNITELDKLPNFHGMMASFEKYPRDWKLWFTSAEPEKAPLPGDWENSCNELQRMLIVRSLRPDRVLFCATTFIINYLGPRFVEPPVLDMKAVVDESTCLSPLVFVLSPGVDPTGALLQLAETTGMSKSFHALSLGQGQAPIAKKMIEEGVKKGHWVFLANCHLSLSWMPGLDKLVDQLEVKKPHIDFRLWLSSSPHPEFPINILQASIKMTTEPPKGVRANMKRLYHLVTEAQFTRCAKPVIYRKLLFSLCFFHSILLERKKFLQLGWNIIYGFNNSDFEVSENLLSLYLNEYDEIPWDALKYLIAEVNYGGHVTDDWDRRLLTTYINDYFCEAAVTESSFKLSSLAAYYIPHDGPLSSYKDFINMLPSHEHPDLFGQHPNADIASQIAETRTLFDTLLSLQPQVTTASTAGSGPSREDKVLDLLADVRQNIPKVIDFDGASSLFLDPSPLDVVLLQEIQRYNALLTMIKSSLTELEMGIKGLVVMSASLEETFNCMYDARVPPLWEKAYPSLKPLAAWTRDLCQRVLQFSRWAELATPPILFWLSGFTFPNGFLTAVLQSAARQNKVSVDTLSWDFTVSTLEEAHIQNPPKDGVYVRGLFLEGAAWNKKATCLVEAAPMQMVCPIPAINFKPMENRKKMAKNTYLCPCYYFPIRSGGAGRASFVIAVELKSGGVNPDHWIKRGTALLMSLDT